jgi:hypothetical protein
MSRSLGPLVAVAVIALIGAGCSDEPAENGGAANANADDEIAVKFAECMRDNGVKEFPDPDASGELTIDGIVNGSSLDTSTPAWETAIAACKDLQPPGFTGHKRSAEQQDYALRFAQCMRENGVEDFPDPTPDGPLIDTTRIPSAAGRGASAIPGFKAAQEKCSDVLADALGERR